MRAWIRIQPSAAVSSQYAGGHLLLPRSLPFVGAIGVPADNCHVMTCLGGRDALHGPITSAGPGLPPAMHETA